MDVATTWFISLIGDLRGVGEKVCNFQSQPYQVPNEIKSPMSLRDNAPLPPKALGIGHLVLVFLLGATASPSSWGWVLGVMTLELFPWRTL